MDQDSVHMVAASKVPMLKPENGNAPLITKLIEGVKTIIAPTTAEEKAQRSSEVLDQTFDRLQKLISQLEIHSESISQEDVNQKFLRSLSLESNTHTIVWMNKHEIDTLSLDDLYNNLKIYEPEVKGTSSSSTNTQNVAFVSSNSTSSTNGAVNTAHGATTASTQATAVNSTTIKWCAVNLWASLQDNHTVVDGYANNKGKEILEEHWKEVFCEWASRNQENRNRRHKKGCASGDNYLLNWDEHITRYPGYQTRTVPVPYRNGTESWPKAVVNTARPKAVLNAVKGNQVNAVKGLSMIGFGNHGLRQSTSRFGGVNMSYLPDFEEINRGYVAFGGNPKGGKITGKGTIKTVPRKNNMYSVDLNNIVPKGGLTCLFAKATSDESKLWHRRLGHINFKTMNKLVKGNLVRGLPSKLFENPKSSPDAGFKPLGDNEKKVTKELGKEGGDPINKNDSVNNTNNINTTSDGNNTNNVNTVSSSVNTTDIEVNDISSNTSIELPNDPNMPELEDIVYLNNYEDVGVEADMNNLNTFMPASLIPTTRTHKDHPVEQIIGDLNSAPQTRRTTKNLEEHGLFSLVQQRKNHKDFQNCLFACFLSQEEPKKMDVKSDFLYGKIKEEVYVCQPSGFEDPDFPDRVYKVEKALYGLHQAPRALYETFQLICWTIDEIIFDSTKKSLCTEFEKMMHKKFQMSSMGEITFFLGLQVKQKEDGIFISQDNTPMETQKPLLKDEDGKEVDVHLYRSMIGSLMYLTSSRPDIMFAVCQPKLGLWYPKDSLFDLVAYTDSDYARASLDRKSTIGEAEYVAASSCCRQVLWIQNQLLDYGRDLHLEDAEGVDCLPNATIFEQLTLMSAKTTAWNEFSSTMASAFIRLATNQKFYFSKYIFESMVKNLENVSRKILMYPRFVQVFLNKQVDGMSKHNKIYVMPSHTNKIFGNMKRVGKGFSRSLTPLFLTMMVQAQEEMGEVSANPTDPHHTPTIIQPLTSQPKKKQNPRKPKRKETKVPQLSGPTNNVADEAVYEEMDDSLERAATTATSLDAEQDKGNTNKTQSKATLNKPSSLGFSSGVNTPQSDEDSLKLKKLMELCTNLQNRVIDLEKTKTSQAQEIISLKRRGRIDDIDANEDIYLVNVHKDEDMFWVNDLEGHEVVVETKVASKDVN
ncbi:putative ribonuclease H-like domain-containing protein [Tanacetum coccineum]|uniref:Ribonuclease H-like domain-containing protein n=1 Tax=Tanacetum coccineum TaxID=301880 RepID=A0ABQ4ZM40_9ASTR